MPAPTQSRSRESCLTATGAERKCLLSMSCISPEGRRDTLFSHPGDTQTGVAVKAEGASRADGFLPEDEGLLGHEAATSRDVPILAPGSDSRDGLCKEISQDGWLMQPTGCEDHSSMHAMLEHSRPCILGSAAASGVHSAADGSAAARYVPHEKCYEDSQVRV